MDMSACRISMKTHVLHTPAPVFKLNMPITLVLYGVKMGMSVGLADHQLSSSSWRDPVSREYIRVKVLLTSFDLYAHAQVCTHVHLQNTHVQLTHINTQKGISAVKASDQMHCVL